MILTLALSILLAVTQAPAAQPDDFVKAYAAAFNAGEAAMRQFLAENADASTPIETRLGRYRRMKAEMGTIAPQKVEADGTAITAEMSTTGGAPATFLFQFSSTKPPKLRGIQVRIGGPAEDDAPAGVPAPPRDEATTLGDVRAAIDRAAGAGEFSGAVLVARGRTTPVLEHAVGLADADRKLPNTLDTRFNVGSIGKHYTTVAVAQLVAAGRLALTDTVGKYLPEYPNPVVRDKVTIEMLLGMQSGIGDFFGPAYEKTPKTQIRSLEAYLPLFANEPLLFEPGQGRQYSNGGFIVLGLIVAKASGRDYYDYVRTRVFDAAKMTRTGFFPQSQEIAGRAVGYTLRLGAPRRPNAATLPERGSSAGGAYSTPRDLLRYAQALAEGQLVALDALAKTGGHAEGIGIAGGAPGLNATLDTDINGYTIVVMANQDPPAAERLAREIRRLLNAVRK